MDCIIMLGGKAEESAGRIPTPNDTAGPQSNTNIQRQQKVKGIGMENNHHPQSLPGDKPLSRASQ